MKVREIRANVRKAKKVYVYVASMEMNVKTTVSAILDSYKGDSGDIDTNAEARLVTEDGVRVCYIDTDF